MLVKNENSCKTPLKTLVLLKKNRNYSILFIIKENHVLCAWSKKALSDGEKKPPMI